MRLLLFAAALFPLAGQVASIKPDRLRCEYRVNPAGIDVQDPELSWADIAISPKLRGQRQTAYRILVASTPQNLALGKGDLWDTGKIASDESAHIVYAGKPLTSRRQAFWKVRVWDEAGRMSAFSAPAQWSMGLLEAQDWRARWIGKDEDKLYKNPNSPYWLLRDAKWIWQGREGVRYFKTAFPLPSGNAVKRAIAVIGADRAFELRINGKLAGKGNFATMPEVIDLRDFVAGGVNQVVVRATQPGKLIANIHIELAIGQSLDVTTGGGWQSAEKEAGPWTGAFELGPYGMAPYGEVGFIAERALPARMLRKEFTLAKPVRRATLYVSGLGLAEMYLNGAKVGDHVLSPGLTDYDKRVLYVTHDVTKQVAAGKNALGAWLGNGRYWAPRLLVPTRTRSFGYPKLLAQLEVEHPDGSRTVVATDASWKLTANGPIRDNSEYDGEEYDARNEMPGWAKPGLNEAGWEPARAVAAPGGRLSAQMAEPLRVTESLKPVKVTEPRKGVWIFDLGQNMVGWCRLKITGEAGQVVTLRYAETLKPDGTLYTDNLRSARSANRYTLRGGGVEIYEPRFTYHGFRYVEVAGLNAAPPADLLEGRVVHDALARTASFESSNPLLNAIHKNIWWGVRGNYRSIPTDCPQRDEKQGWLGDRSVESRGESYLYDVAAFYSKWMTDIADAQRPTGSIPDVAPAYWPLYNDGVVWPSTFVQIAAMLYDQYGDRRAVARHYPAMKQWIAHMRGFIQDGILPKNTYGDWCVPPERPELIHSKDPARVTEPALLSTAYFHEMLRLMARFARVLDKPADAAGFEALQADMRAAFNRKWLNSATGLYANGTQTASVLPLAFGMAPEASRAALFENLVRRIDTESKGHVGTGLVGAQWLMRTLTGNGRPDVAYTIATQKTYPSWGYMIDKGATTIWELWNGDTADPAMNSGNHVMLVGDLNVWFYESLAGLRPDPEKPGFKRLIVQPVAPGDLTSAKASHTSLYGDASVAWRKSAGKFALDVTVPANTGALVFVPAKDAKAVMESGLPAQKAKGVKFVRAEAGAAVYEVTSGVYRFIAPL